MSLFLDVLTVVVFIFVIYRAYKKGIIRALIEFVGFIASFVAAFFLSLPFGNWISNIFIYKFVNGRVTKLAKSGSITSSPFFKSFAGSVPKTIEKVLSETNSNLGALGEKAMKSIIEAVSVPVSALISREIAFFIILIVCFIVIRFIARASDVIRHVPVVGTLNSLAGAAVGIAEAFIIMFIICTLLSIAISLMALQKNPPVTNSVIDTTYIYKYINNINPLRLV